MGGTDLLADLEVPYVLHDDLVRAGGGRGRGLEAGPRGPAILHIQPARVNPFRGSSRCSRAVLYGAGTKAN